MKSTGLNLLYLFLVICAVTLFAKFDKKEIQAKLDEKENEIIKIQAKFDREVNNNVFHISETILLLNC